MDLTLLDEFVGRFKAYNEHIRGTKKSEDTKGALMLASKEKSHVYKYNGNCGSNRKTMDVAGEEDVGLGIVEKVMTCPG